VILRGAPDALSDYASRPVNTARLKRQLNIVLVLALADAFLLVPLLYGFITGDNVHKEILGPIHGVGFLALVGLTAKGALDGLWAWWFPGIVVVTFGPPGSIIGDLIIRNGLRG
jgi:hypothetical protein